MAEFKDMLKYYRKVAGLSQADFAKILGLSPSTISMYEVGEREPSFEVEEKIADYFNIDLNTLRGKDTEYSSEQVASEVLTDQDLQFLDALDKLNYDGKEKVREYLDDLVGNEKYKKDTGSSSALNIS